MTQDANLVRYEQASNLARASSAPGGGEDEEQSPLWKIHQLLKGRYKWAILLGLFGGLAGAIPLYLTERPLYRSVGIIQVRTVLPVAVYQTPDKFLTNHERYIETQMDYLRSRRLIDMAMDSEPWKALGRGPSETAVEKFIDSLHIYNPPRTELIHVAFQDPDRRAARVAVDAILDAYSKLHIETATQEKSQVMRAREDLRSSLEREIAKLNAKIMLLGYEDYGTTDLGPIFSQKLDGVNRTEMELRDVRLKLSAAEAAARQNKGPLMLAEVLQFDQTGRLRTLVAYRDDLARRVEQLRSQGLGPQHRELNAAVSALKSAEEQVDRYVENFSRAPRGGGEGNLSPMAAAVDRLHLQEEYLTKMLEKERLEMLRIGQRRLEIEALKQEVSNREMRLEEVKRAIEQQKAEEGVDKTRISIYSRGDWPLGPFTDPRRKMAAMGGMAGGMLGFGVVVLLCALDRRFRSADDAKTSVGQVTLLGTLPNLPEDLTDPEQAALAAHCVHQIRTLLQLQLQASDRGAFAITSPAAGTGKTSLSIALGVSFASANSRTLLVDCDLVGGGLTARLNLTAHRKLGQILKLQGLVNEQQIQAALTLSRASGKRIGELLQELGYVTRHDVDAALDQQRQSPMGMLDALAGEKLDNCITETGIAGLYLLPLGTATPHHVGGLSPGALRRLLAEARTRFDTVLVDTGPVPGSLEASMVAKEVDGVVMVVSRGEQRYAAEKSLLHLMSIGVQVAGMVFNRATHHDVEISGTRPRSVYRRSSTSRAVVPVEVVSDRASSRFGPVGQAVASYARAASNGTNRHQGSGPDDSAELPQE